LFWFLFHAEKVVEVSVKYLPEWGGSAVQDDPRFELVIGDAYQYLLDCEETFDVVILDISDPIEAGPGIMLYTKELYQHVMTRLNPMGVFVTQAGVASAVPPPHANAGDKDTTCFAPITNTLREVFSCVVPYTQTIPSFGDDWGFVMAFNNTDADNADSASICKEWTLNSADKIDLLIDECISGGNKSLKMYDGLTHLRMFNLAKPVRKQMAADNRIMTKDNPVYMY
jgi:thermospermine synthase